MGRRWSPPRGPLKSDVHLQTSNFQRPSCPTPSFELTSVIPCARDPRVEPPVAHSQSRHLITSTTLLRLTVLGCSLKIVQLRQNLHVNLQHVYLALHWAALATLASSRVQPLFFPPSCAVGWVVSELVFVRGLVGVF